jgi:hypothetical protein
MGKSSREPSDDLDRIRLNALSRFGFFLGTVSMVPLGLQWVVDVPSRLELAALVLLVCAAGLVIVGIMAEAWRSGFSFVEILRLFVRVVIGFFATLRAWFLP